MLLVNKADLLPLNIRKRWAEYFKARDILYVFWSAKAATATLEGKKLSGYSEDESASLDLDTKVYGRDELLMRLQAEAESIVAQRKTSAAEEDHDVSSSDSISPVAKHVVVGFVGYPNVGKSSTINALFGNKRTGVTHTPGKIKLTLYDHPGTILPCFSISRNELSPEEDIQMDQLAISNLCQKVAKGLDAVQISRAENKLALVSTDVIYRLKSLAEDIMIWMQWSSACDAQILYNLYISIGKEIVQNNKKQAKITQRPKEMICDLERFTSELYTRKGLFMNKNGQLFRVFREICLARAIREHQRIIKHLKVLFDRLGRSEPMLSFTVCRQLDKQIQDYKYHLSSTLDRAMRHFKSTDVPQVSGVHLYQPNTKILFETISKVMNGLPHKPATAVVNSDSSSSAKKFLEIVSDTRHQSALKFVREVNPLFKGVKDLISEALDPKCIGCFERNGYYFTTCCEIVLCRSCAQKNTAFICKEDHKLGANLHFPIILSKPVGKRQP